MNMCVSACMKSSLCVKMCALFMSMHENMCAGVCV